jgi:hypothetical protein
LATIIAVALGLLPRIGLATQTTIVLLMGKDNLDEIGRFMEDHGAAWGIRRDVVARSTDAIYEFVTHSGSLNLRSPLMSIAAQFDEFRLDIEIEYDGPPVELTDTLPSMEELANGFGVAMLSHYIIRESADQVRVKKRDGHSVLCLHFEH